MYGVVTRNLGPLDWNDFDVGFYEVKDVSGRITDPSPRGVNMVSCFGDTKTAENEPSLVCMNEKGDRATRERPQFDWAYICPSRTQYREGLYEVIEACTAVNPDVRLDDVGFPRPEFCYCATCTDQFNRSSFENRDDWRAHLITNFVERAVSMIPGKTYLTLYPDPYPGHLFRRSGIDIKAIESVVDEFVIPVYDMAYSTTYWLEILVTGFMDLLAKPFSIELYAVNIDLDNLIHATEVANAYTDRVLFAYDAATAKTVVQRLDTRN